MWTVQGGSLRHAQLAANVIGALVPTLRGTSRRAFTADLRVRVIPAACYAYPDVTTVCGKPQIADGRQNILSTPL